MTSRNQHPLLTTAGRGLASEELRRHNLSTVLRRLHLAGPSSRSELTTATELNRSTVADLITELSGLGLVTEGPGRAGGPGRPSPVVSIVRDNVVALAIELSVDSIAVATVGLGGHIYSQRRLSRTRGRFSPEETVHDVVELARPLLEAPSTSEARFVGTGVAAVGLVRRSDGMVRFSPNLRWRDVPIGHLIDKALGLNKPVVVGNEADLAAIAEFRRGVRPGTRHLIYVSGEVGLGAGIIVDGRLLSGMGGYGGEVGHTLINPEGRRCHCGAVGCWESEAGEDALLHRAGLIDEVTGVEAVDRVTRRASEGDEVALSAIAGIGRWLGLGLGDMINVFNPELVVLGGLYHRLYQFIEPAMRKGVNERALEAPLENVTIADTALGIDAPLVGAAEQILSEVLNDPASIAETGTRGVQASIR